MLLISPSIQNNHSSYKEMSVLHSFFLEETRKGNLVMKEVEVSKFNSFFLLSMKAHCKGTC